MNTQLDPVSTRNPLQAAPTAVRHSVLCVDDDPDILRLYRRVLERTGCAVDSARDGVDGWEAARSHPYDLIITDEAMPRMSGLEMARRLRLEGFAQPIIIATAQVAPLLEADLSAIHFAAILLKPFPLVDLLAAVGRVLRGTGRSASFNAPPLPENQVFHLASPHVGRWGLNE